MKTDYLVQVANDVLSKAQEEMDKKIQNLTSRELKNYDSEYEAFFNCHASDNDWLNATRIWASEKDRSIKGPEISITSELWMREEYFKQAALKKGIHVLWHGGNYYSDSYTGLPLIIMTILNWNEKFSGTLNPSIPEIRQLAIKEVEKEKEIKKSKEVEAELKRIEIAKANLEARSKREAAIKEATTPSRWSKAIKQWIADGSNAEGPILYVSKEEIPGDEDAIKSSAETLGFIANCDSNTWLFSIIGWTV
jgi:hypothetical protein